MHGSQCDAASLVEREKNYRDLSLKLKMIPLHCFPSLSIDLPIRRRISRPWEFSAVQCLRIEPRGYLLG